MAKVVDITVEQFIEMFKADLDKYKEFVEGETDYPSEGMSSAEWFEDWSQWSDSFDPDEEEDEEDEEGDEPS